MIWPWSEIKRLREQLTEHATARQLSDLEYEERIEKLRDELTRSVQDGALLAQIVEAQSDEMSKLRQTVSTFRKIGTVIEVKQGKRSP